MRYLRDEFPSIMSSNSCGRIPSHALSEALASPFLQASEAQALRALLRWAACACAQPHKGEHACVIDSCGRTYATSPKHLIAFTAKLHDCVC